MTGTLDWETSSLLLCSSVGYHHHLPGLGSGNHFWDTPPGYCSGGRGARRSKTSTSTQQCIPARGDPGAGRTPGVGSGGGKRK